MEQYIPFLNLLVNIVQVICIVNMMLIIMNIYQEMFARENKTAQKVEEVREALEVSSATLAQESTLKTLQGRTIIVENKVDEIKSEIDKA